MKTEGTSLREKIPLEEVAKLELASEESVKGFGGSGQGDGLVQFGGFTTRA
jgi:hypothetical protein